MDIVSKYLLTKYLINESNFTMRGLVDTPPSRRNQREHYEEWDKSKLCITSYDAVRGIQRHSVAFQLRMHNPNLTMKNVRET